MKTYYFTQPFVGIKFIEDPISKQKFISMMVEDKENEMRFMMLFSDKNGLPLLEDMSKQFKDWVDKGIIPKIPEKFKNKEKVENQNYIG